MPIAGADTTLSSMPARECRADSKGFHMTLALAIDLGGTKVEAALVDDTGHIVTGSRTREATGAAAAADRAPGAAPAMMPLTDDEAEAEGNY